MMRVLVVDDSATIRRMIQLALASAPDIEVALARSGEEAIRLLHDVAPDVVTLDIILPVMDGLECLSQIMFQRPCPVVMMSSLTSAGAFDTLTALSMGAVDFIEKPRGPLSPDLEPLRSTLIRKLRVAAQAHPRETSTARPYPPRPGTIRIAAADGAAPRSDGPIPAGFPVVIVGVSTGGPPALEAILAQLSADFPAAVIIAQHMPEAFTASMAARLGRSCAMPVEEVKGMSLIRPGRVYVARGDADVVLDRRQGSLFASSVPGASDRRWHPNVDRLVESAMRSLDPRRLIGVLLTGMGDDGALAMSDLRARGGRTIAESGETAVVWGMPRALVERGGAERVEPLPRIAATLAEFLSR